jgi:hypothetical protein
MGPGMGFPPGGRGACARVCARAAGLHNAPYDGHRMVYVVCRMDRMGLMRGSYGGEIPLG